MFVNMTWYDGCASCLTINFQLLINI